MTTLPVGFMLGERYSKFLYSEVLRYWNPYLIQGYTTVFPCEIRVDGMDLSHVDKEDKCRQVLRDFCRVIEEIKIKPKPESQEKSPRICEYFKFQYITGSYFVKAPNGDDTKKHQLFHSSYMTFDLKAVNITKGIPENEPFGMLDLWVTYRLKADNKPSTEIQTKFYYPTHDVQLGGWRTEIPQHITPHDFKASVVMPSINQSHKTVVGKPPLAPTVQCLRCGGLVTP